MTKTANEILEELGPEFRAAFQVELDRAFLIGAWRMAILLAVLSAQAK
ncbi:MAG: hypothetical protein JKY94_11650 [Rhodobacteraceae bacterium]|nr:hypothetical protein [Paracoccaceae bacterium]